MEENKQPIILAADEVKKPIIMTPDMTALQIALICKKEKPHIRYATHKDGVTVGGFDEKLGHWCIIYRKCPTNSWGTDNLEWVSCGHELLINDKLSHEPEDWTEVNLIELAK